MHLTLNELIDAIDAVETAQAFAAGAPGIEADARAGRLYRLAGKLRDEMVKLSDDQARINRLLNDQMNEAGSAPIGPQEWCVGCAVNDCSIGRHTL